ncbi:MAG: ABC transporter substrate-binding protein [Thermoguttaceae bacterium]|jgi:ABC-type transport system substrate-binding protein
MALPSHRQPIQKSSPPRRALAPGWSRPACLLLAALWLAPAAAQAPLYEQPPFDRITLDAANDNLVLNVRPIEAFPNRKLPDSLPKSGKLVIERIDEPGTTYELLWRAIVKIELFEQLILDEVNGLVASGQFDRAYEYFLHLENEKPDLPGLKDAYESYLYEEAKALQIAGDYQGALARLREICDRNPQRPGLDRALAAATDKLVEQSVAADQHWIAREYLDQLEKLYPQQPLIASWRQRLQEAAGEQLAAARKALEADKPREAQAALRRMSAIWPDLPGADQVRQTILRRYPRFVVGVLAPSAATSSGSLHDWAARRTGRLVERALLELAGPGTEGGKYICPVGEMKAEDLGRRLTFQLRSDIRSAGGSILTGYDLARRLLAMADPASPSYLQIWADLCASVSVENVYTCLVQLNRPFVLPQAMLQTAVYPNESGSAESLRANAIGPYYLESSSGDEAVFLANPSYFAGGPARAKEIVERRFRTGAEEIRALRRGEIDVIDRLNPWEVGQAREIPGAVVRRYAVPLVHCLIPNPKRPLTSRRAFRRALVYGINREAILGLLTRGAELPGCRVVSGPFLAGVDIDDPLDYAYEESIEPRGYEPHLAITLAEVARRELAEARKKAGEPAGDAPKTVLAYQASEAARLAVAEIRRQLKIVGIVLELRELGDAAPERIPADVDLLYAELAMWEPIVDAERLLGEGGLAGEASPYMRQALLRLRQSVDWPTVGRQLREIHRLAHAEASIIPLWQMTDHFAHVDRLEGIGPSPVTLYQDIENWQIRPPSPTGKP